MKAAPRSSARKGLWRLPSGQGQESGFPGHLYTSLTHCPSEMMVQQWGQGCWHPLNSWAQQLPQKESSRPPWHM